MSELETTRDALRLVSGVAASEVAAAEMRRSEPKQHRVCDTVGPATAVTPAAAAPRVASTAPVSFKYSEVVRGKGARRDFRSFECPDCAAFMSHLPPGVIDDVTREGRCRHKVLFTPPVTQSGYWDVPLPRPGSSDSSDADA